MGHALPRETHDPNQRSANSGVAAGAAMQDSPLSTKELWAGRLLSGIAVLFLAFDAAMKVLTLAPAVKGTTQLGYPETVVVTLGLIQVVCLVVYLIPRTSVLGAILWTGYLGGAVATHVRVGRPLFSHTLFPTYVAALLWAVAARPPCARAVSSRGPQEPTRLFDVSALVRCTGRHVSRPPILAPANSLRV